MLLKIHGKIGFAKIFKNSAGYTDLKIHQSNYMYMECLNWLLEYQKNFL